MEEETKTPLTDYYSKPYQGKRYKENGSESFIVPAAIKIMAWIALIVGILGLFRGQAEITVHLLKRGE